jgi:hypothetical protein
MDQIILAGAVDIHPPAAPPSTLAPHFSWLFIVSVIHCNHMIIPHLFDFEEEEDDGEPEEGTWLRVENSK